MTNQPINKPRIANYYGVLVVLILLFQCSSNPSQLPDPLEAGWEGEKVCECVEEQPSLRILKCTFPPGVGHERHFHATHFGYTLKGSTFRITDAIGTREVEVKTGTKFYNESIEWHEVKNIGDSTAIYLIMEPK